MPLNIDREKCNGCGDCVDACPVNAITLNETAKVNSEECIECGSCVDSCPNNAITLE